MIGITEGYDPGYDPKPLKDWLPKPAIIITKRLDLLLKNFDFTNENVIIHATITGMGGSKIEPNVPKPEVEIEALRELNKSISQNRIVLRVDPIIPEEPYFSKALEVIRNSEGLYSRLRISFLDMYPHVKERFNKAGVKIPYETFHAPLIARQGVVKYIKQVKEIEPEICGEPDFTCKGCVSEDDLKTLGLTTEVTRKGAQRYSCACLAIKHEIYSGYKRQCPSKCLFCYWRK
jgi:DNA repair photolyase